MDNILAVVKAEINSDNEDITHHSSEGYPEIENEFVDENDDSVQNFVEVNISEAWSEGQNESSNGSREVSYMSNLSEGTIESRKKAREQNSNPRVDCPVCGDKVNGIHYGIYTCEGCKNFFKRSVTTNKTYSCYSQASCDVTITIDDFGNKQNRKGSRCQACRLEACLDAGMVYMGYGYNRSSRKIRKAAFLKTMEGGPTNPAKKQKTGFSQSQLDNLPVSVSITPVSAPAVSIDPLATAQPTTSGGVLRRALEQRNNHHVPSKKESPNYHDSNGSILASMLKAPLKEAVTVPPVVVNNSKSSSPEFSQPILSREPSQDKERKKDTKETVCTESEQDLAQLSKEQTDIVITMLREQLKYERDKNKELKHQIDIKDTQVESLEKQVFNSEKHMELSQKFITRQKFEIERLKMEINRIGLFRNLLSKNTNCVSPATNGSDHSGGSSSSSNCHNSGNSHVSSKQNLDTAVVNGHDSENLHVTVKNEPIE